MDTPHQYGLSLLVDTVKMIVGFSTSIIGAIYAALVLKNSIADKSAAYIGAWWSGVAIFFGLIFLFYVAERSIKGTEPTKWLPLVLIAVCWVSFLVGVGYAAAFGFDVANAVSQ
ncbi:hypothetical protein MASR1M8_00630 [Thermomonas brevis]